MKTSSKGPIIRLVRETVKVDVNTKDENVWMLLWQAVMSRGKSVNRLPADMCTIVINARDKRDWALLFLDIMGNLKL